MKKLLAMLTIVGIGVFGAHSAAAFTVEQHDEQNADGTQKFADPDEQMPNFVMGATEGDQSGVHALPFDTNSVTPPTIGDRDAGAAAFGQAYSHLGNNH